jgi:ATP-dependent Lon protease
VPAGFYSKKEIHIHLPEGAIPKDGPSAGITMLTALASALTGRPVRDGIAMTGEITLRGAVLPVGGIKEKVLAARAAGISEVYLPERNRKDVEEIDEVLRQPLTFHFVAQVDDVLGAVLVPPLSAPSSLRSDGPPAAGRAGGTLS